MISSVGRDLFKQLVCFIQTSLLTRPTDPHATVPAESSAAKWFEFEECFFDEGRQTRDPWAVMRETRLRLQPNIFAQAWCALYRFQLLQTLAAAKPVVIQVFVCMLKGRAVVQWVVGGVEGWHGGGVAGAGYGEPWEPNSR